MKRTIPGTLLLALTLAANPAIANDPGLRLLKIPASACKEMPLPAGSAFRGKFLGEQYALDAPAGGQVTARVFCPLQLGRFGVGETTAIKMTKFRVMYQDSDAGLTGSNVRVELYRTYIGSVIGLVSAPVCEFTNTGSGNPSTRYTTATKSCDFTFQSDSFYNFVVILEAGTTSGSTRASFAGIDFPQ